MKPWSEEEKLKKIDDAKVSQDQVVVLLLFFRLNQVQNLVGIFFLQAVKLLRSADECANIAVAATINYFQSEN